MTDSMKRFWRTISGVLVSSVFVAASCGSSTNQADISSSTFDVSVSNEIAGRDCPLYGPPQFRWHFADGSDSVSAVDVARDGSFDGIRRNGRLYFRIDRRWVWLDLDSKVYREFFRRSTVAGELSVLQVQELVDPIVSLRAMVDASDAWSIVQNEESETFVGSVSSIDRAGAIYEPTFSADVEFEVKPQNESRAIPDVSENATWFGDEPADLFIGKLAEYDPGCILETNSGRADCLVQIAREDHSTVAEFSEIEAHAVCPLN